MGINFPSTKTNYQGPEAAKQQVSSRRISGCLSAGRQRQRGGAERDVTCHVAVDQLWSDRSAAVHVDVKVSGRVAAVFVRLAGLLVHSCWGGETKSHISSHKQLTFITSADAPLLVARQQFDCSGLHRWTWQSRRISPVTVSCGPSSSLSLCVLHRNKHILTLCSIISRAVAMATSAGSVDFVSRMIRQIRELKGDVISRYQICLRLRCLREEMSPFISVCDTRPRSSLLA